MRLDSLARVRGSRCASVVKMNWSKSMIKSLGLAKSRYRYLNVSDNTNESILLKRRASVKFYTVLRLC